MILTFCSDAHSNVHALKQCNDNLFGKFCSNVCLSFLYMSDCDKALCYEIIFPRETSSPTPKFSNHFSYLFFVIPDMLTSVESTPTFISLGDGA